MLPCIMRCSAYIEGFSGGGGATLSAKPCLSPGRRFRPACVYFLAAFGLTGDLGLPFFRGLLALAIVPSATNALSWDSRLIINHLVAYSTFLS